MDDSGLLGEPEQSFPFGHIHRQRFLADDVLAGCQHLLDHRRVQIVRGRDVDAGELWHVEEIVEGVIGGDTDLFTLAPPRLRAGADQPHHLRADPSQRFDVDRTDEPGTDDADPQHAPPSAGLHRQAPPLSPFVTVRRSPT